eukprot:14909360-Alexandrium_andersonii.AAC.1
MSQAMPPAMPRTIAIMIESGHRKGPLPRSHCRMHTESSPNPCSAALARLLGPCTTPTGSPLGPCCAPSHTVACTFRAPNKLLGVY